MGGRMALRLLAAGHAVTVWNRDGGRCAPALEAGAQRADTPRAAVAGAEIVLAMLRDDVAAAAVWDDPVDGALAGLAADTLAIDASTLTPTRIAAWGRACAARGIAPLAAPVAGSRPQAEAGQLIFFLGGAASAQARAMPVLHALGTAFHPCGRPEDAAMVKLAVNVLFGTQVAVLAELIGALRRQGTDPGIALAALAATPVASPAARLQGEAMLAGRFAPLFPVELVEKDFSYAVAAAGDPAQAPMTAAAQAVFARAIAQGYGADNLTGIVRLFG